MQTFPTMQWTFSTMQWTFPTMQWTFPTMQWPFSTIQWTFPIMQWTFPTMQWTFPTMLRTFLEFFLLYSEGPNCHGIDRIMLIPDFFGIVTMTSYLNKFISSLGKETFTELYLIFCLSLLYIGTS